MSNEKYDVKYNNDDVPVWVERATSVFTKDMTFDDAIKIREAALRKGRPVATGVLKYFPDAIDAIAEVSRRGNDQHNPGQPLHWAREKSTDQMDAAARHLMDYLRGHKRDKEGNLALAQVAWRVMAQLQLDLEGENGK